MRWSAQRITALVATGAVLFFLFLIISSNVQFQRQISSTFISFKDFPEEYSNLLKQASKEHTQPVYDYPIDLKPTNIPPKIHFIWFQDLYHDHLDVSRIPHDGSPSPKECTDANPNFEVKIWGEQEARELLEKEYAWFIPVYDGYKYPIQRVDAFKYFMLLHYGGIYMDLDITCRRSLAPLLAFPAWFPEASPLGVNNDLMATRAGHPLMRFMTLWLKERDWNLIFPYLTIFFSTGPKFTSDALYEWWKSYGQVTQTREQAIANPDSWLVLPREFYSEEYTFFGHRPGGTWHGKDVAVVLWFVDHPYVFWSMLITILVVLIRFRARRGNLLSKSKV